METGVLGQVEAGTRLHGQESECYLEGLGSHRRVLRSDVVCTNHLGALSKAVSSTRDFQGSEKTPYDTKGGHVSFYICENPLNV